MKRYRWKNRYVTEKVYKAMLQRSANGRNIHTSQDESETKEVIDKLNNVCTELKALIHEKLEILQNVDSSQNQERIETLILQINHLSVQLKNSVDNIIPESSELKEEFQSSGIQKTNESDVVAKVVSGNRIIDILHLSEQLQCLKCTKPLLLNNIQKETANGLGSLFYIICKKCQKCRAVTSSPQYSIMLDGQKLFSINTKMALG